MQSYFQHQASADKETDNLLKEITEKLKSTMLYFTNLEEKDSKKTRDTGAVGSD